MSTLPPVSTLAPLPVVLPLAGAALLAATRKLISRAIADVAALLVSGAVFVVSCLLLHQALAHTIVYWFGNWFPRGSIVLGVVFYVDPAGAALAALAALLTTLGLVFSSRYPDSGHNHLHPLLLIFLAGMCGFCLTGDLFNLFVFFELMSTAAFALCGLNTRESAPLQGAFNFAVTNTVAAFLALSGISLLYAVTGALNMAQIGAALGARHDALVLFAFALLLSGFLTKAAILPFHLWLADAHAVAPTSVCVLFSGVMVELGLYAVLRLQTVVFGGSLEPRLHAARLGLVLLGAATALLGGVMCYAEHHLKRVLAFSTVSHSGLMLMAVGLQSPLAATGFLLYLLGHALVKSGLFFTAGLILHSLRSMSEPLLWGKGRGLPWMAVLWLAGGLGLAGVPVFATAMGESVTSSAAEALHFSPVSVVFLLAGALTGSAVLRIGLHTFFGWGSRPISDRAAEVDEMPEDEASQEFHWTIWFPPALCLLLSCALLLLPTLPMQAGAAATRLADQAGTIRTLYTGRTALPAAIALPRLTAASALRGSVAGILALLLACTSVFRERLPRPIRWGAWLEGPLRPLRAWQSGHPGDYVLWLTVGVALMGSFALLCLS